jgi:hypothetical protein
VWLGGQGWVRVDPTAAVSPERIEWGLEQAVAGEGSFLSDSPLSPLRFRGVAWVNMLRLRYDALTWRWQAWVVGFNRDRQFQLLSEFFDGISVRKFVLVLLGSGLLVLGPVAFGLLRRRPDRRQSEADRLYLRFCERLARVGVERKPGESPARFGARAARAIRTREADIKRISALYNGLAYGAGGTGDEAGLAELRSAVARFRPGRA